MNCIYRLNLLMIYANYIWGCDFETSVLPLNFSIFQNFSKLFFIVVQVQLSPFSPHYSPHPSHPHFPPLILPPFCFVHVPENPFPFLPPIISSHLPSGYCQLVLNFKVSGFILLACLFCWLGSSYRWDHMVFVFHHLGYFT